MLRHRVWNVERHDPRLAVLTELEARCLAAILRKAPAPPVKNNEYATGRLRHLVKHPDRWDMGAVRVDPDQRTHETSGQPGSSQIRGLVRKGLMRLAELIRKDGGPYPLTSQMVNVWV